MNPMCRRKAYYKAKKERTLDLARKDGCIQLPGVYTFVIEKDGKAQALKVLEEASELVEAVKSGDDEAALYEAMDVYQALGNLIEQRKWTDDQVDVAYKKVVACNKLRGRYGDA